MLLAIRPAGASARPRRTGPGCSEPKLDCSCSSAYLGVLGPTPSFCQRLPVHLLGLDVLALVAQRPRKIVHDRQRVWVLWAQHLPRKLQRLPVHLLSLDVLALPA
jgi:hypothetical protein